MSAAQTTADDGRFFPYGRQSVTDEDIAAVVDTLRGDWLTTGPAVARFERALAAFTTGEHVVAVNSGTAALHVAYAVAGLQAGDEIITSPLTFAATANAARYLGAAVRFVDVREDTGNIDPELVEAAITPRTKLLVAVDFAGHPADYEPLRVIAERHGLVLVADAAHSLGATYRGRPVGTLADLTATSFHPVKPVTTAEGGAIITSSARWDRAARSFRSHGMVRDPTSLVSEPDGPWYMEQQALGFNYRIPDISCALGVTQLAKLPAFLARRRALAARYQEELADISGLSLPVVREGVTPGWHLFVVKVDAHRRRAFFDELRRLNIGAQVHYLPVYRHPYYRDLGHQEGSCPVAESHYARSVSIPLYPALTDGDQTLVIERVRRAARAVGL